MDRASDSGSEGWGFESLPVYHEKAHICLPDKCVLFSTKSAVGGRNPPAVDEIAMR